MDKIITTYQNNLIYIFTKEQLNDPHYNYLVIIKDETPIIDLDNCLTMHYQDDFESLLNFSLPTKNRKTKQIISYGQCWKLINDINYGVLSFCHEGLPYSIALNHINMNGRIFFHCATIGFKLNSIDQRASYLVVKDLGINLEVGTHYHESVAIYGTIREVNDFDTKKEALLTLINDLAPKHPYNDKMVNSTTILELEIDYLNGKSHIR